MLANEIKQKHNDFRCRTVMFCISSHILLRGHPENKGNFIKLLQFRIDVRKKFKKHFV